MLEAIIVTVLGTMVLGSFVYTWRSVGTMEQRLDRIEQMLVRLEERLSRLWRG